MFIKKQTKKQIKTGLILGPILAAFVVLIYVNFRFYLEAAGKEIVNNFLTTNSMEIQQGNLMGSLYKNQRFLFSSQFVSGIKLYDTRTGRSHISLGKDFGHEKPEGLSGKEVTLKKVGFFHSHIFYFLKDRGLVLVFDIKSDFLTKVFYLFLGIFIAMLGAFFFLIRMIQKKEEKKRMDFMYGIARRLKHDVSSRLSTIKTIAQTSRGMASEEKSTQLSCCYQIDDMLRDLNYDENMPEIQGEIPLHFTALAKEVYNEAVTKNRSRDKIAWKLNLDRSALDLCLEHNSLALVRSLHNLVDNAVESIRGEGEVSLSLRKKHNEILLEIRDTGLGIPQNEIHKVGTHKFSTKEKGQGLGVYHAKKCLKKLGGTFAIHSILGQGTTVTLSFPWREAPGVYRLESGFFEFQNYVLVDDDSEVHERACKSDLWQNENAHIKCYFSFPPADKYDEKTFFLVDYDLKDKATDGIKLIKEHGIEGRALLATGHYDDPVTVQKCMQEGIKILPKILL